MSNDDSSSTTPHAGDTSSERLTGRVKWFNNRAGFGFVTVMEGEKKDEDIFVHHSGILVNNEQYKYLVQGEYVSFSLRESDNDDHPYQAGQVRGVLEGWLMCETRNANRSSREDGEDGEEEEEGVSNFKKFENAAIQAISKEEDSNVVFIDKNHGHYRCYFSITREGSDI